MNEFSPPDVVPRRGMTSIETTAFLKKEFPQVPQWTCWLHGFRDPPLHRIIGGRFASSGSIGGWSWKRVPTSYPVPAYWIADDCSDHEDDPQYIPHSIKVSRQQDDSGNHKLLQWVGALEIRGTTGEQFLLFSCLSAGGGVGKFYFVSTQDFDLLERFARDVYRHFELVKDQIRIDVIGGDDIVIEPKDDERIVLPPGLQDDIEKQVFPFFEKQETYKRLRLRHRRGFLFVGEPGTGKTMMLRHLIRQCYQRYKTQFFTLAIKRKTDEDDVANTFSRAARHAPSMVILEDVDSLTTQCNVTRSAFLAELDGIGDRDGLLVIGTTNHPESIDPALVHRPSRFDRVWHSPLPDRELRQRYLEHSFGTLDEDAVHKLAQQTKNWSFAYLKELHTTASIMAIAKDASRVTTEAVLDAFNLLDQQFRDGKKNHVVRSEEPTLGFAVV